MEMWKDIPFYVGFYQISDLGRVRSVDRVVSHSRLYKQSRKGIMLRQAPSKSYLTVCLCRDGRERTWRVGNLVLLAFVGECPDLHECCHNNGNPHDNRLRNLRYDTKSANSLDAVKHGTHAGIGRSGRRVFAKNKGLVFDSTREAADFIGCTLSGVNKVCYGSRKSVYGFELEYV